MKRIILTAALALLACATAQAQQMAEYNNEKGLYLGIGASSRNLDSESLQNPSMVSDPDDAVTYLGTIGWRFNQYFDLEARLGEVQEVCTTATVMGTQQESCVDGGNWVAMLAKVRFPFGVGAMKIAPYAAYGQYRSVPDWSEVDWSALPEDSQEDDTRARIFGLEIDFLSRLSIRLEQREYEGDLSELDPSYTLGILYHF